MRQFFVGEVPEIIIKDGVVHLLEGDTKWCMPLRLFRLTVEDSKRALAKYDAKKAVVVAINGRGGHAALS